MWRISKSFDFCYGHRVWSQTLNCDFSLDSCLKCRHLHGHQGHIIVTLKSTKLKSGMVTDFKHLNWFKKLIDDFFDHKFIIDVNDPVLPSLFPYLNLNQNDIVMDENLYTRHSFGDSIFWTPIITNNIKYRSPAIVEVYEGLVLVNFVPTSENFSSFLFDIVQHKMKELEVTVESVKFFETPKSSSEFIDA